MSHLITGGMISSGRQTKPNDRNPMLSQTSSPLLQRDTFNLYGSNSPQLAAALSFPRRRESSLGIFSGHPPEFTPAKAEAGVTVVTIAQIPRSLLRVVHLLIIKTF